MRMYVDTMTLKISCNGTEQALKLAVDRNDKYRFCVVTQWVDSKV